MSKYSDDSATYAKENIEKAAAVSGDVHSKFRRLSGNRLNFRTAREKGIPGTDESGRTGNVNETKSPDRPETVKKQNIIQGKSFQGGVSEQTVPRKQSFSEYRSEKLAKVRDVQSRQKNEQNIIKHNRSRNDVSEQNVPKERSGKPTANEQKGKPAANRKISAKVSTEASVPMEKAKKKAPKKKSSSGPGLGMILIGAFVFGLILFCTIDTISTVSIAILGGVGSEGGAGTEKYVDWMIAEAEDDTHGYRNVAGLNTGNPDYDCGGFVSIALQAAGIFKNGEFGEPNDESKLITSTLGNYLISNGFMQFDYANKEMLVKGDILMSYGHVETYIGDGQLVGAHSDFGHPEKGDQSGNEVSVKGYYENNWVHVYRYFAEEEETTEEEAEQNIITEPKTKMTK